MSARDVAVGLVLVVTAVLLQSIILSDTRLQPFGSAPALVVLVIIAVVRYLDPEPAILLGFTAGLLVDLLGGQPIGLWAMVLTVVAYVTLRIRDRADFGPLAIGLGVFLLTVLAGSLFVLVGTLFGLKPMSDPAVLRKILLPAAYNVLLAGLVLPGVSLVMKARARRRGWAT